MESLAFVIEWICLPFIIFPFGIQCQNYRDAVEVSLKHATFYTSPLASGFNSSNFLKNDFSLPPVCVTTLPLDSSWILIDFGYTVYGISEVRLVGDHQALSSENPLSYTDIKLAEKVSQTINPDKINIDESQFFFCGQTGAVSPETISAVVMCKESLNARWLLIKRRGQMSLCYVLVYQSSVQSNCLVTIPENHIIPRNTFSQFRVFQSKRYISKRRCFHNCENLPDCAGVAYIRLGRVDFCQLLGTIQMGEPNVCDNSCTMAVNKCNLGNKTKISSTRQNGIYRLSVKDDGVFAVSLIVEGFVRCSVFDCGKLNLFLSDSFGKLSLCSSIDSKLFRVLDRLTLICNTPIRNPQELVLRTDAIFELENNIFNINVIYMQIIKANSPLLNLFNPFVSLTTTSTLPTTYSTTPTRSETSTTSSKPDTTFKSTTSVFTTTTSRESSTIQQHESSSTALPSTTFSTTTTEQPTSSSTTITSSSTKISTLSQTPNENNRPESESDQTSQSEDNGMRNIFRTTSDKEVSKAFPEHIPKNVNPLRNRQGMETHAITTSPSPIFETLPGKRFTEVQSIPNENVRKTQTSVNVSNIDRSSSEMKSNNPPYIWIIIVGFTSILLIVILFGLLVAFFDKRKKKKEWDLPDGGLYPREEIITKDTFLIKE